MPRGQYQRKQATSKTKIKHNPKAKVMAINLDDLLNDVSTALAKVMATGGEVHSDSRHKGEFVGETIIPAGIDAVLKARGAEYGDFTSQAEIVQGFKDVLQKMPHWNKFLPFMKEGVEMIEHKIGRAGNGNPFNPDTWEDIAGYAKLIADRIRKLPINQKPTI